MPAETILLLAGTAEAAALARRIAAERPEARLLVSLAGRTDRPDALPGEMRIGGFGGAEGLAAFLRAEGVTRLVDATHPFAIGMSRNALKAATLSRVPRLCLSRPPWKPQPEDRWQPVSCLKAARDALPEGACAFLALGRQHLAPFADRPDLRLAVRTVDPGALPFPAEHVVGKPSTDPEAEAALFARLAVTHLVARNSGGAAGYAKIEAARALGLIVVMIERMEAPEPPLAATVDEAMAWLESL